jgi:YHS domain-containing protein
MKNIAKVLLLSFSLLLLISVLVSAQSKMDHKQEPAIGGYCPVAYLAAGKALKGDPKYSVEHEGHLYYFVNAEAKKAFEDEPAKFIVKYDGWCATGVALGKKLTSDPKLFTVHDGKTYLFSSRDAKRAFDKDIENFITKAEQNWPKLK